MADEGLSFFSQGKEPTDLIALASYPRCGNSLLRWLLERLTGVWTGSDTRPDRVLSRALAEDFGMKGEGVIDRSVAIVKTHWPERFGFAPFEVRKAIILVRNPWDALDSYWNMNLTHSHHLSLAEEEYTRLRDKWNDLVSTEAKVWRDFYHHWVNSGLPYLIIRYEDLLRSRGPTLQRIVAFLRDEPCFASVDWDRALEILMPDESGKGPYHPRKGGIGLSRHHFSEENNDTIMKAAGDYIRAFGYHPDTFPAAVTLPRADRCTSPGRPGTAVMVNSGRLCRAMQEKDRNGRLLWFFADHLEQAPSIVQPDGQVAKLQQKAPAAIHPEDDPPAEALGLGPNGGGGGGGGAVEEKEDAKGLAAQLQQLHVQSP